MADAKQKQRSRRGAEWQTDIEVELEQLRISGEARVKHAWVAARRVYQGGRRVLVPVQGHAEADYYGLCDGGRFVAFDAKRTSSARFQFPDPRKPDAGWWHQVSSLTEIAAFGGLAFLYVLHDHVDDPFRRQRYVLPVRDGKIAGLDPRLDRGIDLRPDTPFHVRRGLTWLDVVATHLDWWSP